MVHAVYNAIQNKETLVIEAGTGSGKSFGYLIPVIESTVRPIVISTGTIALQEQLIQKDIPFILEAAGKTDLNVKLVKGRRNYLCIQKMTEFDKTLRPQAPEKLYLTMLKTALAQNWDGDKATLDVEIPKEIWEEIQSDSEDCLGNKCSYFKENPYRKAREDLEEADILVTNHALYLQDLISVAAS
jgi:ATP-dependent DNA helicase DinG